MGTIERQNKQTNGDRKMENLYVKIKFDGDGEYGVHDGFFNCIVEIHGRGFYIQCCMNDGEFDQNDCGHDWGICGDVNASLAEFLTSYSENSDLSYGYRGVLLLLAMAYQQYCAQDTESKYIIGKW